MKLLELMYEWEYELKHLKPTSEEIDGFIRTHNDTYGLFTYSNYKVGNGYFISFHDNHNNQKHYHIDVGYVNFDYKVNNVTHLMLDKYNAPEFISFIRERRAQL
jgi:hypothetical protein